MEHEFRFPPDPVCRSLILCRCASCAGEGIAGFAEGLFPVPAGCGGSDCLRLRLNAGLKLYFTFACANNSLNTFDTFVFSFADASTNPFSQSTVTTDSVVSYDTCKLNKIKLIYCTFESSNTFTNKFTFMGLGRPAVYKKRKINDI